MSVSNSSVSGSSTASAKGVFKLPKPKPNNKPKKIRAFANVPVQLRVKVYSDKPHGLYGHLMVYDWNPKKKGKLIADKLVHFDSTRGATATFDWIPRKPGKHKLFAVVLPYRDDPNMTNHVAKFQVNVQRLLRTQPK